MPPLDYEERDELEDHFIRFHSYLRRDPAAQRSLLRKYDEVKDDLSLTYAQARDALIAEYRDCLPAGDE